jgi:FKBP-type peptidyl-prolyl cis-trans isomerase
MILLVSCSSNEQASGDLTRRGYRLERHVSTNAAKPVPGEYAYFQIIMRHGDSVLNTSYGSDQIPRIKIPTEEEYTKETPIIIDALALMAAGDSATLYFPTDSLDDIPPQFAHIKMIEYDLKFLEIKTDEEFQAEMQAVLKEREDAMAEAQAMRPEIEAKAAKALNEYNAKTIQNLQKTDSGLEYVIHSEGTGELPQPGDMVAVHYYGTFYDGKRFDDSYEMGEPYRFPLGQGRAIQGWDIGVGLLKKGSVASLFVPPALAYGETGYLDIPGNTPLYFLVELTAIN